MICHKGCCGRFTMEGSRRGKGDKGGVVGLWQCIDNYRESKRNKGVEGGVDGLISVG